MQLNLSEAHSFDVTMNLHNAVLALLLAGTGSVNANDKCFCPVLDAGSSGACGGSPYKKLSTAPFTRDDTTLLWKRASGELRCQEFCAEEPDECKGFAWFPGIGGDNCHLYDSVPGDADSDQDASCYGLTGTNAGFTELEKCQPDGGKCSVQVYSGTTTCGGRYNEPYCIDIDGRARAKTVEECKAFCDSRGNLCQGFDFDEGKANAGVFSCYERRYRPNRAYDPNRNDYTDWFCHTKDCDCGTELEFYQCPTPPPVPPPTNPPVAPPTPNCDNDSSWQYETKKGALKGCGWVGRNISKRCDRVGTNGVVASEACPSKCKEEC